MSDPDPFKDATEAYERAVADADYIRGVWVDAGRPLVLEKPSGLCGVHPLWTVMVGAEEHANRFRVELGQTPRSAKAAIRRGPGRPVGATSAPDRIARYEVREPDRVRPGVTLKSV